MHYKNGPLICKIMLQGIISNWWTNMKTLSNKQDPYVVHIPSNLNFQVIFFIEKYRKKGPQKYSNLCILHKNL